MRLMFFKQLILSKFEWICNKISFYNISVLLFKRVSPLDCYKQDWSPGFIFLLPQAAVLLESNAGSYGAESASGFIMQNHQTLCSMHAHVWSTLFRMFSLLDRKKPQLLTIKLIITNIKRT